MITVKKLASIAFGLCVAMAAPLSVKASEEIMVNGSTTVLPIMQKASEAYMAANPNVSIAIAGGGSGNGIKALIDGFTTVAMASRDIKANELERAKAKKVFPERFAVGLDALVPIVHPKNDVDSLSLTQLKDIYAGRITNWKDVGGKDAEIVVISRDTSSGTYETWEDLVMKKEKVKPAALLQASSGAAVQAVSKNQNAIGYIGIGYMNPLIKGLTIDGLQATAESAMKREWPLARELYIFTNGKPTGAVEAFITFLLDPKKGQKAVLDVGFVPINQ